MRIIKVLLGIFSILGAVGKMIQMIVVYLHDTSNTAAFSESMGGIVAACIFIALGVWLLQGGSSRKSKNVKDS